MTEIQILNFAGWIGFAISAAINVILLRSNRKLVEWVRAEMDDLEAGTKRSYARRLKQRRQKVGTAHPTRDDNGKTLV